MEPIEVKNIIGMAGGRGGRGWSRVSFSQKQLQIHRTTFHAHRKITVKYNNSKVAFKIS
jgi:hypothetical protein